MRERKIVVIDFPSGTRYTEVTALISDDHLDAITITATECDEQCGPLDSVQFEIHINYAIDLVEQLQFAIESINDRNPRKREAPRQGTDGQSTNQIRHP